MSIKCIAHDILWLWDHIWSAFIRKATYTKRVICFACSNLLRNYFEYEYEYKQKPLECRNSQLQKRSMFNIAVTGNLNTNKTEHKFLMKLYILDVFSKLFHNKLFLFLTWCQHMFSARFCSYLYVFLDNNSLLPLKPHSNNVCLHLHFQCGSSENYGWIWRTHMSRGIDKTRCSHLKMSIVVFISNIT